MNIRAPQKPKGRKHSFQAEVSKEDVEKKEDGFLYMPEIYMSPESVKNRYQRFKSRAGEFCELGSMTYQELEALLFDTEQLELMIRQRMSEIYTREYIAKDITPPDSMTRPSDSQLVHIRFEDDALRIFLPHTFIRTPAESWHLSKLIEAQLKQFEQDQDIRLAGILTPPIHIIVKRKDTKRKSNYRDNDNLEMTKIINAICRCFFITDSADHVEYSSLFSASSDPCQSGTEIIVFENSKLDSNWKYFSI